MHQSALLLFLHIERIKHAGKEQCHCQAQENLSPTYKTHGKVISWVVRGSQIYGGYYFYEWVMLVPQLCFTKLEMEFLQFSNNKQTVRQIYIKADDNQCVM